MVPQVVIMTTYSTTNDDKLTTLEVITRTTSSAASDYKVVSVTTFLFQWSIVMSAWSWFKWCILIFTYRQASNIRRTVVGNEIVHHSDVVGASPVGAAPTTSSFSIQHLASGDYAKTTATGPYSRGFTVMPIFFIELTNPGRATYLIMQWFIAGITFVLPGHDDNFYI